MLAVLCSMAAGRGPKFLYIYGPRGAGLSHLLEAFLPGSTESDFRVPLYQPDVKKYAVDDIETLDEGYSRELLQLQNAVYADPDARLVCAGRFPPKELPLPEGVKNRLLGGPCYFVAPLNEEDRFRELSRQAALRGLHEAVCRWDGTPFPSLQQLHYFLKKEIHRYVRNETARMAYDRRHYGQSIDSGGQRTRCDG